MYYDFVDLRLLVATADSGSLSRAASSFPIALSAASNRMRALEQRFGVALFTRHADGMHVTPAGQIAIDHARRVLAEAQLLDDAMEGLAGRARVRIRIAANTAANSSYLPPVLGPFLRDYPEVDVQIDELPSADVLKAVQAGDADLGIFDSNAALPNLVSHSFRHDRLVILAPVDHPLVGHAHCSLRDALQYPFVGMPRERAMQRFIEERARFLGQPLTLRVRAPSVLAIAQLVAQNVGIAVLPETAARRHTENLATVIVQLDDMWATRELRLCTRDLDGLSAQARQLLAYLAGTHSARTA